MREGCWGWEGREAIDGQVDGGDIPPTEPLLLPAGFRHVDMNKKVMSAGNWGRIAAAKRLLLRDILIAANIWLNIMKHFHRITVRDKPFHFLGKVLKKKKPFPSVQISSQSVCFDA